MDIMVELILFAEDFPVETVTEKIGVNYSQKIKKHDVLLIGPEKNIPKVQDTSSITYSTGCIEAIDVEVPIEKICKMLIPQKKQIVELVERYNLEARFCVVINLTDNPIISFSKEFIDLASAIHAEIEIDSYVDYDEKGNPISNKKKII